MHIYLYIKYIYLVNIYEVYIFRIFMCIKCICMCYSQFGERIKGQRGMWNWSLERVCMFGQEGRVGWASVIILPHPPSEEWLQKEFNKLEFVYLSLKYWKKTEISVGKSYFLSRQSTSRIGVLLTALHPDLRPGPLSPGIHDRLFSWSPSLHPCFLQSVLNTQSGSFLKGKSDHIPTSAQNPSMAHYSE